MHRLKSYYIALPDGQCDGTRPISREPCEILETVSPDYHACEEND